MYKLFISDPCIPGRYIAVGLSSGVAVKRGSTVDIVQCVYMFAPVYKHLCLSRYQCLNLCMFAMSKLNRNDSIMRTNDGYQITRV